MANGILIVDDAAFMRMMIKDVLTKNGYTVLGEAENGAKAIEKFKELTPDLVIMDITMPEVDGIVAARVIREFEQREGHPPAKILALTADVLEETWSQAMEAGVDAVLEKPISPEALRRALADVARPDRDLVGQPAA